MKLDVGLTGDPLYALSHSILLYHCAIFKKQNALRVLQRGASERFVFIHDLAEQGNA